jgi:predicted DNA-binding protein (UPF0251 family)/predicted Fe-Mo cluster-binding NifX family protein
MNPRKKRYARRLSESRIYKPADLPIQKCNTISIGLDEFEAMRLVDYEDKSQIEASKEMQVSRATLQRLLLKARSKMVESILNNDVIEISNEITNIKLKGENKFDIESKDIIQIAFPTDNKVTIASHFGKASFFSIYTINHTEILHVDHIVPPPHAPGVLPKFLQDHHCDVIITTNMGKRAIKLFEEANMDVILGAKGRIDVNLNEYLAGFLESTGLYCDPHQDGRS